MFLVINENIRLCLCRYVCKYVCAILTEVYASVKKKNSASTLKPHKKSFIILLFILEKGFIGFLTLKLEAVSYFLHKLYEGIEEIALI